MHCIARNFTALGTPCSFTIHGTSQENLHTLAHDLLAELERLEAKYSRYRADSILSKINKIAAFGGMVVVDDETRALLNYAQTCYHESRGLFDITSSTLTEVWHRGLNHLPSQAHINQVLLRVGWHRLKWDEHCLDFPTPGLTLDLGGIVKEYAVDRLVTLCRNSGITSGFVNLGGDLAVIGPQPNGEPWQVGIRSPWDKDYPLTQISISYGALASSGDYERCVWLEGKRYGHILNPLTGWPTRVMAAVSVWSPLCVMAGSAATIALLKEEEGPAWLRDIGWPCWWATTDGAVGSSSGLAHQGV